MPKMNLAVSLEIQAFSGSGITDYNMGLTNTVIMANGKATQRPSINISEDGSAISGLKSRARGIYYWEANSKIYIVNDNDLFETTQDSTRIAENTGTFSSGTESCTILETLGTPRLVILDSENNKGWVMTQGKTLDQIASNFPSTLTHGGAILDTYLFVMDEDGVIYNSNVNDPTTFNASGFITAERENDKGVYLAKHHDNVVAFLTRTIEFLFDNGNTVGSPLNRREDVSYTVGCASGMSVWEDNDIVYFLGTSSSGQISVYKLENFQVTSISTDAINSYFTQGLTREDLKIVFSGLSAMGHSTLIVTVYVLTGASPGEVLPRITLTYDSLSGLWGFWETALDADNLFPLVSWTRRTGGHNSTVAARTGEGLLSSGDIININDNLCPVDTLLGSAVYEPDIYETDIYAMTSESGSNISSKLRLGLYDGETSRYKFQQKETLEMENTPNSQTMTVRHSDESSNNFNTGVTIDTSLVRKDAYQGGRFMKRNYQLEYSGNEQFFIESLDVELEVGE